MYNLFDLKIFGLLSSDLKQSSSSLFNAIVILVLFVLILVGAYFTTRFLGNFQMNKMRHSNMRIIEAVQVGPGKTIQLVKVGEKYMVIGVTKDRINFLTEVDNELLNMNEVTPPAESYVPFSQYLNKVMSKSKKNK